MKFLYSEATVANFASQKWAPWALLLLAGILPPSEARSAPVLGQRGSSATEEGPRFLGLLEWPETPESSSTVRRLSANLDPEATEQLLSAAAAAVSSDNQEIRMALVEALHERSRGRESVRVVRRLIGFFTHGGAVPEKGGGAKIRKLSVGSDEAQKLRVRASAARALAHSAHPQALQVLLSYAREGDSMDPIGARVARVTLGSVPMNSAFLSSLGVTKQDLELTKAPPLSAQILSATPEKLGELSSSPREWMAMLQQIADAEELPVAFLDPENWSQALKKEPIFGLRALSCLVPRKLQKLRKFSVRMARKGSRSSDRDVRATAVWALAALAPAEALNFFGDHEAIVTAALLSQSSSGALAGRAQRFWQESGDPEVSKVARFTSLLEVAVWPEESNRQLWQLGELAPLTPAWISPLAARTFSPDGAGSSGVASRIILWLEQGNDAERSAAVAGLAHAESSSAQGLLLRAYRNEQDPSVRRGIVRALGSRPGENRNVLRQIAELDPDEGCRARAEGRVDKESRGFLVISSSTRPSIVADREARRIAVVPAPDGFVGIVGENF